MSVGTASFPVTMTTVSGGVYPETVQLLPSSQTPTQGAVACAVITNNTPFIGLIAGVNGSSSPVSLTPYTSNLYTVTDSLGAVTVQWQYTAATPYTLTVPGIPSVLLEWSTVGPSELPGSYPIGFGSGGVTNVTGAISGTVEVSGGSIGITGGTVDVVGNVEVSGGSIGITGGNVDVVGNVTVTNPNATLTSSLATSASIGPADFGTGADGAATIAFDTTLTRDVNYTTLVVNAGVVLSTAGWVIRATTSVAIEGTIDNSATNATNSVPSVPGAAGSLGGGASPPTASPAAGESPQTANYQGGAGGNAGASGTIYQGGTTGPFPPTFSGIFAGGTVSGGASGARYNSTTANPGGGAGAIAIFAPILTGTGTISANGGNGTSGSGGASGGGGGGVIVIACETYPPTLNLNVQGGTGSSTGGTTATSGANGRSALYVLS